MADGAASKDQATPPASDSRDVDGSVSHERAPASLSWLVPSMSRISFHCMILHFLLAFCEMVLVAPQIALFEHSLCYSWYQAHDPSVVIPRPIGGGIIEDESLCKIPPVQADLATIRGWKSTLDTIPVLLVAIPAGRLADRIGQRKMISIALLGVLASICEIFVVCAFPQSIELAFVLLSSVLLFVGGGLYSCAAIMWAMASGGVDERERSKSFYYIFSAFYMAELLASSVAAVTTDISPWIPCGLAVLSIILALIVVWSMPERSKDEIGSPTRVNTLEAETDTERTLSRDSLDERRPLLNDGDGQRNDSVHESTPVLLGEGSSLSGATDEGETLIEVPPAKPYNIKTALANSNIRLALPLFLVGCLRYTILNVLIQYAHLRFDWRISKGAIFYSETAIVNTVLFSFVVPQITTLLRTRYSIDPEVIDLNLARASVCLMSIGSLLIGLARTDKLLPLGVAIFASGFGSRVSTLSLVSYWIDDKAKASLYASIAVLENIGHAVLDPTMQNLLASVLTSPISWLPLPFYTASVLYALAGVSGWLIQ